MNFKRLSGDKSTCANSVVGKILREYGVEFKGSSETPKIRNMRIRNGLGKKITGRNYIEERRGQESPDHRRIKAADLWQFSEQSINSSIEHRQA